MAFVHASRVRETSTTTGTGDFTLAGVFNSSYRSFSSAIGANNTCYYVIQSATEYEEGLGTVGGTGLTLARTTVIRNHLGGTTAVNFGAGTKDVFVATLAPIAALLAQKNTFSAEQDFDGQRLTLDVDADTWLQYQSDDVISLFALAAEFVRFDGVNKRVELKWTDDTTTEGPELKIFRSMTTAPTANDPIGVVRFAGPDSTLADTTYGKIRTMISDGTDGSEDGLMQLGVALAGTLTDHVTLGGGGVRIPASIAVYTAGKTASALGTVGTELRSTGVNSMTASGAAPLLINRTTSDGNLIEFYQDGTLEGNINVTGTTVALAGFTGVHEGIWEPGYEPNAAVPIGTVLEAGEGSSRTNKPQATRYRVAGPGYNPRVAGVYHRVVSQSEHSAAGLGSFVVRCKGPIQNGDLLCMSDEPGVACCQDDDSIRSITIGKAMETDLEEGERLVPAFIYCG